ncbi:MAG: hypothetical protein M0D55_17100 [Elusimicrobiota bacterium]|nr:MAG: hypothetical protein M0D55_17100 [Elusimicrobiota bacterium]
MKASSISFVTLDAVHISTLMPFVFGFCRISWTTSMPVMPGMLRSTIARSTVFLRRISKAAVPPSASSNSWPCESRTSLIKSRMNSSSSTIRTRAMSAL